MSELLSLQVGIERAGFRLDVSETLALAGITALFGPSGSGKSTLLRAIAGFERPATGRVALGDEVWFDHRSGVDVPPHRRPVGFMFQDDRLFTHLNVAGNLRFAERRRRTDAAGMERDAVIEALGLEPLLDRRVGALSGGERRRVALARTLLSVPRVLLLDEPLSGLDAARKAEILPYLESVPKRFDIPTIYVSHDIDEVATLVDDMLVVAAGRVQMHGPVTAVLERLDLQPLTGRFEAGVIMEGRVRDHDHRLHLTHVDVAGDALTLPLLERIAVGDLVRLRIRARDVSIATRRPLGLSIRNVLSGVLTELVDGDEPGSVEVWVQLAGGRVRARLTQASVEELGLAPGVVVYALIKSVSFERSA